MQKRKKLTRLVTCEVLLAAGRSHPLDVLPLRIVELLHLDVVLVPLPLPCELQLYPDRVLTIPSVLGFQVDVEVLAVVIPAELSDVNLLVRHYDPHLVEVAGLLLHTRVHLVSATR